MRTSDVYVYVNIAADQVSLQICGFFCLQYPEECVTSGHGSGLKEEEVRSTRDSAAF